MLIEKLKEEGNEEKHKADLRKSQHERRIEEIEKRNKTQMIKIRFESLVIKQDF